MLFWHQSSIKPNVIMKNKNFNFKRLVSKMQNLEETEQGKIKGGIMSLSRNTNTNQGANISCYPDGNGTNLSNCKPPEL